MAARPEPGYCCSDPGRSGSGDTAPLLLGLRGCLRFGCGVPQDNLEKGEKEPAASWHQRGCGQGDGRGGSSSAGIRTSFDDKAEESGAGRAGLVLVEGGWQRVCGLGHVVGKGGLQPPQCLPVIPVPASAQLKTLLGLQSDSSWPSFIFRASPEGRGAVLETWCKEQVMPAVSWPIPAWVSRACPWVLEGAGSSPCGENPARMEHHPWVAERAVPVRLQRDPGDSCELPVA